MAGVSEPSETYLDKYGIDDAVRDGATVPILYEGRKTEWSINEAEIDILFDRWFRERDYDVIVASEIRMWLKRRVRRDVAEFAAAYRAAYGLRPRTLRVADMKHGWGACGPGGAVLLNWHLVFAPKTVLQYVVAHELAHLKHRGHAPRFWGYLREILPGYEGPMAWLDANGGNLSSEFLFPAA